MQEVERLDGIAHPVEDQVRGIEVDAGARAPEVEQRAVQAALALLAGLERDPDAGLREDVDQRADAVEDLRALRIVGVVRR